MSCETAHACRVANFRGLEYRNKTHSAFAIARRNKIVEKRMGDVINRHSKDYT